MSNNIIELQKAPNDIISSIKFSPKNQHLLVGSWDGEINLYDFETKLTSISNDDSITDIIWDKRNLTDSYLSDTSGFIKRIDLENGKSFKIGNQHSKSIQCLQYLQNSNRIASGSWDKTIQLIDPLTSSSSSQPIKLDEKIFTMDSIDNYLVIGTSNRLVYIYDIRNIDEPLQIRESGLKYQTRSIKCMPNAKGYVQSSIEGRIAVEYFDPNPEIQVQKYAFKCHRLNLQDLDLVSPVNALNFHEKFHTLFTGGSDQFVCLWDQNSKKRLKQYPKFDQSIVSLDFKDHYLAIATSDDSFKTRANLNGFNKDSIQPSKLYIKILSEFEGKSKHWVGI
ncbi:hypothetical protein WICMUC_001058 [Wickerhamomyces mucosus]|uniref:Anaphase-promoting complex subunit 4 WD40 domain-containing protein n=1 Tax=Wickerhamomyces mucosus TaxID=1378264 RepID=A0A9P8PVR8_9ASCO|nr:hypothetical protein WICMUC_001058 [Wickerhamomyces mucosus]